jgi:hypothetical protein
LTGPTDNSTEEKKDKWLTEGIIIALIPVLGYALAYIHEFAFCDIFGIPKEFIIVNWPSIITSIGRIIVLSLVIIGIILLPAFIQKTGGTKMGPIARRLVTYIPLLLASFFLVMGYSFILLEFLSILAFLLYFAILDFLGPCWTQRSIKGYRNRLDAQDKRDAEVMGKITFLGKIGRAGATLIVFIILLLGLSYLDGRDNAVTQEEFLVPSTYQESAVLRVYGDRLVCAPLDREKHQVSREFFFINIGDNPNLILTPQIIGPLKVFPPLQ